MAVPKKRKRDDTVSRKFVTKTIPAKSGVKRRRYVRRCNKLNSSH